MAERSGPAFFLRMRTAVPLLFPRNSGMPPRLYAGGPPLQGVRGRPEDLKSISRIAIRPYGAVQEVCLQAPRGGMHQCVFIRLEGSGRDPPPCGGCGI